MAIVTHDSEFARALNLQKLGWHIVLLPNVKQVVEISKWMASTMGYRVRDLNPYTLEYDGRWDGGEIDKPFDGYRWWIAIRDEQDYLMYKIKFST